MVKRDYFNAIRTALETATVEENDKYTLTDLMNFCDKEIARLDTNTEKAKARQAEKSKTPDELTEKIAAVLGNEFMDRDEVYNALTEAYEDIDASLSKVQYRLNELFKAGRVEKGEKSVAGDNGKKHNKVTYRMIEEE